ncbi:hypothetical protein D1BOALGB6SA_403 [Olavius sp. associated proteobacterium Delta 1]|nr:hypothetical protein D1BOALGB6SA_403 [Olavius sp. associated proteobacterium Delta 1]
MKFEVKLSQLIGAQTVALKFRDLVFQNIFWLKLSLRQAL